MRFAGVRGQKRRPKLRVQLEVEKLAESLVCVTDDKVLTFRRLESDRSLWRKGYVFRLHTSIQ